MRTRLGAAPLRPNKSGRWSTQSDIFLTGAWGQAGPTRIIRGPSALGTLQKPPLECPSHQLDRISRLEFSTHLVDALSDNIRRQLKASGDLLDRGASRNMLQNFVLAGRKRKLFLGISGLSHLLILLFSEGLMQSEPLAQTYAELRK
jgi:hypothetical protein